MDESAYMALNLTECVRIELATLAPSVLSKILDRHFRHDIRLGYGPIVLIMLKRMPEISFVGDEFVTYPWLCQDVRGMLRIHLDLVAQLINEDT